MQAHASAHLPEVLSVIQAGLQLSLIQGRDDVLPCITQVEGLIDHGGIGCVGEGVGSTRLPVGKGSCTGEIISLRACRGAQVI